MNKAEKITHLYNRAGFSLLPGELKKSPDIGQSIQSLLKTKSTFKLTSTIEYPADWPRLSPAVKEKLRKQGREESNYLGGKWILEMSQTEAVLHEKMTLFWHNHFACFIAGRPDFGVRLNNTIRQHAMGNFKSLTKAVAREAAMLDYLNNTQNKKAQPNENFARELLELFTIGRGNYTETDIKEAARAFTGWSHTPEGDFLLRRKHHDNGMKSFMGQEGNFNGDDIIDIICQQPATARFISGKLYAFFVADEINTRHVDELSDVFIQNELALQPVLEHLFNAPWFYESAGKKIKSPIELTVGLLRSFNLSFEDQAALIYIQRRTGQHLFKPPNVAGWPGDKNWLDNTTLSFRMRLPVLLLNGGIIEWQPENEPLTVSRRKATIQANYKKALKNKLKLSHDWQKSAEKWPQAKETLVSQLLPPDISMAARKAINQSHGDFVALTTIITALPEYQLC